MKNKLSEVTLAKEDLEWLAIPGNQLLTFDDPLYPSRLKQIAAPPSRLFIQGNPKILNNPQIAIVGSRNPTHSGKEIAYQHAQELSRSGLTITSGLALGIDAASHRGALIAEGPTVAVMGTGLGQIYPVRHQELAEKIIAAGGALISEFSPNTAPKPENFPRRNRIISGLSLGVLVVEAALRSGSLITAKHALEQGREVFAIPSSIYNPLARGCHALLKQGAKLVETPNDVLEELENLFPPPKLASKSNKSGNLGLQSLDSREAKLVECVGFETTPIDILLARSGLSAECASALLALLELKGYIKAVPGGYLKTR